MNRGLCSGTASDMTVYTGTMINPAPAAQAVTQCKQTTAEQGTMTSCSLTEAKEAPKEANSTLRNDAAGASWPGVHLSSHVLMHAAPLH